MKNQDIPVFTKLLAGIGELYGKAISETLTDIYWQTLKRFELEDIVQAFEAHVYNPDGGQYFPKPSDVVRFIEGSGETRALQAWAVVEKAIRYIGAYKSIVFDDLIIHAVLEDMGGWVKLCSSTLDELPFRAHEFQKRYMGFVIKAPKRHPQYCCGISEAENTKNGYPIQPRLIVGDLKKAEAVMLKGGGIPLCIHSSEFLQTTQRLLKQKLQETVEDEQ